MSRVSIILPSRNEQYLVPTVKDLLAKATGDIEVIPVLEGYWPDPPLPDDPRVKVVHRGQPTGMRRAINTGVDVATGKYIMKLDAHCMVDEGFDEKLTQEYAEDNWVMTVRRYSLNVGDPLDENGQKRTVPEKWERKTDVAHKDYHYLSWPWLDEGGECRIHGRWWKERQRERSDIPVDEEMTSQGSCWLMSREHWYDRLDGLHCDGYGDFMQEFQEVGMRTWLGGGKVMVNKRTWYAHLHKGKTHGRGYYLSRRSWRDGCQYSADFWVNNRWPERVHDIEWLVERFWPVKTWPENWRETMVTGPVPVEAVG